MMRVSTPSTRLQKQQLAVRPVHLQGRLVVRQSISRSNLEVRAQKIDVVAVNQRLEARSLALIALEEQDILTRPKVRITIQRRANMGDFFKLSGTIPELGRFVPEVGPAMTWTTGDVWVYEGRIRQGRHAYKVVLRRSDGAYIWEEGPERLIEVPAGKGPNDVIEYNITDYKFPPGVLP